jgi:hypothetical protein
MIGIGTFASINLSYRIFLEYRKSQEAETLRSHGIIILCIFQVANKRIINGRIFN